MTARRLEIGCGPSPRDGYEHNDINPGPHIEHVGAVQSLDFSEGTFVEVYGTGALEHLNWFDAAKFLRKAIRWLSPGGVLVLDAPDMAAWLEDIIRQSRSKSSTLVAVNGWCRWPGDEHKSYWTQDLLANALRTCGYGPVEVVRASDRNGGPSKNDWHLCARAYRPLGELSSVIDSEAEMNGWERG